MYRKYFKRIIDIILTLAAIPFWFIVLIILGPLIYFQDNGPVFYNAPRLGKDGKLFKMYKFRSMKMHSPDIRNEDGSTFNAVDDPRRTKIGKFIRRTNLDETPQLMNIIKGDMSIIGPRPDLPDHFALYVGNEKLKLKVRPGLTGFNQAYFRNEVPWKERIQHDIYYIDNLSIWLDIKVFVRTAILLLNHRRERHINGSIGKANIVSVVDIEEAGGNCER